MSTAIVGAVCTFVTAIGTTIIQLCVKRYEKAQEIKEAREDLEARLRTQVFLWREHAYAVRVSAIEAGVKVEDLPAVPKGD